MTLADRPKLLVRWLGRVAYAEALNLQESLVAARRRDPVPDTLLLLEHPPVITLGRGAKAANVLVSQDELTRRGIEVHQAGRGGDVTYHGPGQLVGYPIVALPKTRRDAHRYLRDLEETLILTADALGVSAGRIAGLTGIWVGEEKLAAIGVRLSTGWITSHGFALNVDPDPAGFATIVPCGIRDRGVTSLTAACGRKLELELVATRVARDFARVFDLEVVLPDEPSERLAIPGARGLSSTT